MCDGRKTLCKVWSYTAQVSLFKFPYRFTQSGHPFLESLRKIARKTMRFTASPAPRFPVTLSSRRLESCKKVLFDAVSCWRYFTRAARQERERHEEQINEGRKQKKGCWIPQPLTGSELFSPFSGIALGIDGYRFGYRSEALNPPLPMLEPSISTACAAVKKPRKTKDPGSGRRKERQQRRREGQRDGRQKSRAVASDPQPPTRIPP